MKSDIALSITKTILSDIQGRYQIDAFVFNACDRAEINQQVAMFEKWRYLVSEQLYNEGIVTEQYTPLTLRELEQMSLYDILEMRNFYMDLIY